MYTDYYIFKVENGTTSKGKNASGKYSHRAEMEISNGLPRARDLGKDAEKLLGCPGKEVRINGYPPGN